jgi:hypothetical protein
MNLFSMKQQRQHALSKADAIVKAAEQAKRELTSAENMDLDTFMLTVHTLNPKIAEIESKNTLSAQLDHGKLISGGTEAPRMDRVSGGHFNFPEVGEFLKSREPGMLASLTEGGELQHVIPGYQVQQFIEAYPSIDIWQQAGARVTDLELGWVNSHQPIVVPGPDTGVFAEGTGPTSDQSATVYVAQLDNPKKHAFLSLPSEEAFEDIQALGGVLTQEGVKRTIFSIGKSVTAALVSSLSAANAIVTNTGDAMADILNLMEAGKDGIFANPSNKFMLNRRTLSALRNTRTTGDVGIPIPLYSPSSNQILGFDVIRNSALPNGVVLFGDFSSAVYLRRAGLAFLLINTAYRTVGAVGLRFTKRADWAFYSDAASASQAEQPVYMLTGGVDLGS